MITPDQLTRLRELVAHVSREHPRTVVLDGLCMHGDYVVALNAALAVCETVDYAREHGRVIAWSPRGTATLLEHTGETTKVGEAL